MNISLPNQILIYKQLETDCLGSASHLLSAYMQGCGGAGGEINRCKLF